MYHTHCSLPGLQLVSWKERSYYLSSLGGSGTKPGLHACNRSGKLGEVSLKVFFQCLLELMGVSLISRF